MLKIRCKLDKNLKTHNVGSLLHGVIMEQLTGQLASELHQYRYNPLKQRLYLDENIWEIVSLEEKLSHELLKVFKTLNEITIKHQNITISLLEKDITKIELKDLVASSMANPEPKRIVKINILSPMSFKSDGQYDIFPEVRKILRSIMLTFDYFSEQTKIYDYDTLEYLSENIRIIDYSLSSTKFELEKVKIPAFRGKFVLSAKGSLQILQLVDLIFTFGELSGIGIKTSMGMGGIKFVK